MPFSFFTALEVLTGLTQRRCSVLGLVPKPQSQISPQRAKRLSAEEWAVWPGGGSSGDRRSHGGGTAPRT